MTVGQARGDSLNGQLLGGRYRLDSLIGRGGMATVYRATDEILHRPVALKLFGDASDDGTHTERAAQEVRLLAALNHPSLVTLYDARVASGDDSFLVMELVDGPTLRDRIAEAPIDDIDVAAMALDLADALHAVHSAGMVHRDIKPSNVLLAPSLSPTREFRAKLADFGIAHLVDSARLTMPGTIMGTAAYLSPEQTRGIAPAPAGDIYSLGLVLLESLTRVRAFPGGITESLVARVQRDPEVPGELGYAWKSLLTAMTSRSVDDRPSALDVAASAQSILRTAGTGPLLAAESTSLDTAASATSPASRTHNVNTTPLPPEDRSDSAPTLTATRRTVVEHTPQRDRRPETTSRRSRRVRRGILLAAAAILVVVGLGVASTSWLAGGRETVSAPDTAGDGVTILSTTMDEFATGVAAFVDECKAAAAAAAEEPSSSDTVPATDTDGADTPSTGGNPDDTESPAPSGPDQTGPDGGAGESPGNGADSTPGDADSTGPGSGGPGNGKGNGNGPGNGKGPGG